MKTVIFPVPVYALLLAAGLGQHAWAQSCRTDTIPASTPTSRFDLHDNGTVTHIDTGLTWMRCAIGQTWNGRGCDGEVKVFTWEAAAQAVVRLNEQGYAGHKDWRNPLVPELASIVERQCFFPRVNEEVFPGTPSAAFWTGMERRGRPDQAYVLDFGGGDAVPRDKSYEGTVRVVRGGPWWRPPQGYASD